MPARDENGKFINGNGGGPGRPKKEREVRYAEIMQTACTFTEWRKICLKAVEQARRGDATARKWLADYLVGVPKQKMELTGADGGPIMLERPVGFDTDKL